MKEGSNVQKKQIDQLIRKRFPSISSPLAQKVSQLVHEKHLYRVDSSKKPVLLINKIKDVAQNQSTSADVRRFLSSQFLPPPAKRADLQKPPGTQWDDYVSGVREIYKNRNYLVYPTGKKRRRYEVGIQRAGISVDGPSHRLQIIQGGKILLDGKEPMTLGERNAAMELMGVLFKQLEIKPEWSKTKQNVIKTLVAGKIYPQGQTLPKPYLTMPVYDFARLRTALKSMKSMPYPNQQQNRLVSAITQKDKGQHSYRQVREALVPLLTMYKHSKILEGLKHLMRSVPIMPWKEFWQTFGPPIYKTKQNYNALHNPDEMRDAFNEMDFQQATRHRLLLPPRNGKMLLWAFDPEKKAWIILIRGLGFVYDEGHDGVYDTFRDGSLWRQTYEMVIDVSETSVMVLMTDATGDPVNELLFLPDQLLSNLQMDTTLQQIITTAIHVREGRTTPSQLDGDAYYRVPITQIQNDVVCFLPTKTYCYNNVCYVKKD